MILQCTLKFQRDDEEELWFAKGVFALTEKDTLDPDAEVPCLVAETARVQFNRLPRACNQMLEEQMELCRGRMVSFVEKEIQESLDRRTLGGIVLGSGRATLPIIGENN